VLTPAGINSRGQRPRIRLTIACKSGARKYLKLKSYPLRTKKRLTASYHLLATRKGCCRNIVAKTSIAAIDFRMLQLGRKPLPYAKKEQ
jgi:hypothetical protein